MSSSSPNDTPAVNGASAPPKTNTAPSSMNADLATLKRVIEQVPDEATDADIAGLLRALEEADGGGRDVEDRLDAMLAQLDGMLGALEPDAATAKASDGQDKRETK